MTSGQGHRGKIAYMYLGRRGALGQFTLEFAEAAIHGAGATSSFIVSVSSGLGPKLQSRGVNATEIETFDRPTPTALVTGYFRAQRALLSHFAATQPYAVINLMPHIWTPLLVPAIKRLGVRFATIVHDAAPHPGDPTARVTRWLLREARLSDRTFTLSRNVSQLLLERGLASREQVRPLFHPDLRFAAGSAPRRRDPSKPLRLLFLGRIMAYKGLDVLADSVSMLRSRGIPMQLGVAGSGDIGSATRLKLDELGAEVINRWIDESEISPLLSRYDALACAHVEASQSGIAATAFGHAMPVVAMPSGGLLEQVIEGKSGVMARASNATAYADAIRRLAIEDELYDSITRNLIATRAERSMAHFLSALHGDL